MTEELQVQELTRTHRRTLREWLDDAEAMGIDLESAASLQDAYENYFDEMLLTAPAERGDPTVALTTIGMALGEHLVRAIGLEWRVVSDEEGTDLALFHAASNGVLFPVDPVAQHWTAQRRRWLIEFVQELSAQLRDPDA